MEIVGRHHDPFTVMEQFERPFSLGVYSQPVTDITGALLARVAGPVAAYNWLVLLSFPLSAAAAYLLARHLALSPAGGDGGGDGLRVFPVPSRARRLSPPYRADPMAAAVSAGAVAVSRQRLAGRGRPFLAPPRWRVTLSNFYGGLIAAVITPVAVAAYWLVTRRSDRRESARRLAITVGSLAFLAAVGRRLRVGMRSAPSSPTPQPSRSRATISSATARSWWSYLMPPIEHPLLGAAARAVWQAAGVREGLLEQQVSLGWGFVALGLIAVLGGRCRTARCATAAVARVGAGSRPRRAWRRSSARCRRSGRSDRSPSSGPRRCCIDIVPMFRSYARFGVVVQLMAALLAGIGVEWLRRLGTSRAQRHLRRARRAGRRRVRRVAVGAVARRAPRRPAHRWVMQQAGRVRALDCTPAQSGIRLSAVADGRPHQRCWAARSATAPMPNLSRTLAANGYTHLIVRRDTAAGQWFADHAAPDGLPCRRAFRRWRGVCGHGAAAGHLHGGDDRILPARARCANGRGDGWERTRPGRS